MTSFSIRTAIAVVAFAAAFGCSTGTPYSKTAMPALAPGQGRILIYMASGEVGWWPAPSLDGQVLGKIKPGTFFYVDRPTGPHQVGIATDPHLAGFGNQGATAPVTVLVQSDGVAYVQVTAVATPGMVTGVLTREDPADAQRDLSDLDLVPPALP